ncbi:MAG: hypothetical protein ACW7DQ_17985 [Paraglaciecola chathamensis]
MYTKECLACGFTVEIQDGVSFKQCPSCDRFYEKVEKLASKGKSFSEASPIAKRESPSLILDNPQNTELQQVKECPFCSELIKESAKKCRHCSEILDPVLRAADEKSRRTQNVFMNSSSAAVAVTETKSFPHLIHFILTLFTGGLWLIV